MTDNDLDMKLKLMEANINGYTQGLKDASSTEQKPKWIPVSERLPEKNMSCLVSAGKLLLTQIAIYSDLMGTIDHKIFYQGDYGHENFVDITEYVKAWMPLPEPYKAERSDKK